MSLPEPLTLPSFFPPGTACEPPGGEQPPGEPGSAAILSALEVLAREGPAALAQVDAASLERAWEETLEALLDPGSAERRELQGGLLASSRLSPAGLQAALEAVLGGQRGLAAKRLLRRGEALREQTPKSPVLVILAGNLPALAVQPLLPALALGRPVLFKSSRQEPSFTPALLRALVSREPRLAPALAAAAWPGGHKELEEAVFSRVGKILAYGDEATLTDLRGRVRAPLVEYGPRLSLGFVAADADPAAAARGLARDVALFEQQGCLSVQAVFVAGDADGFAEHMAASLREVAKSWPPGNARLPELAAVRQVRAEAELRGLCRFPLGRLSLGRLSLGLAAGTVVVEPRPRLRPSPGLRTVRVHPLTQAEDLLEILAPWRDRVQGLAYAGTLAPSLRQGLEALGISRLAPAGELQHPDASWANGGLDPLEALA